MAKMSREDKQLAKLQAKQDKVNAKLEEKREKEEAKLNKKNRKSQIATGEVDLEDIPYEDMSFFERRKYDKSESMKEISYKSFPELQKIKPLEGYTFHSDYFKVDDQYGCVMSFFHREGAQDDFLPFWGLMMLPSGLGNDIVIHRFDQMARMPQSWIDAHQSKSETVADIGNTESARGGGTKEKGKARRRSADIQEIGQELLNGASYLQVSFRLLIKAPSLDKLDRAIEHIDRVYKDRMGTVYCAPYFGEQRKELETMFSSIRNKVGKNFYFTSEELAGNYSLVTHGFEDVSGEYVGKMFGDVNPAAVLFDVDDYNHHIVVAGSNKAVTLSKRDFDKREKGINLWGSKIALSTLMNNHKTVEFVLNGSSVTDLCPDLSEMTSVIGMDKGSINMFEMFGDVEDEMSIYASQMRKLKLMAEQGYETTQEERSIVQGSLEDVATQFYCDNNMWRENAQANREFLRVVGLQHNEVPRLREFSAYLNQRYDSRVRAVAKDNEALHADNILKFLFRNMLTTNGDLFDCVTTDEIDKAKINKRVIYDFSSLMRRGKGIMMAQFVNVLDFAMQTLDENDTIIIYGAENISDSVMEYVEGEFAHAHSNGVRIAWLYNSVEAMLECQSVNKFDTADYTILGKMSANDTANYVKALGQDVPVDLLNQMAGGDDYSYYIRRGFDNVIMNADLMLGLD